MCAGYYKMLVGLRTEGKTVVPNPQFDNEPVRYEHRFKLTKLTFLSQPPFLDLELLLHCWLHPWCLTVNTRWIDQKCVSLNILIISTDRATMMIYRRFWNTPNELRWQLSTPPHQRTLARPGKSSRPCRLVKCWSFRQNFTSCLIQLQPWIIQATVPDDEVATLITINKTNFVVASVLARDSKRNIDFDFSLHQNFPTAKLV